MAQSLDEFLEETRLHLEAFAHDYRRQAEANPEHFPLILPDGQEGLWFEFFTSFDPGQSLDAAQNDEDKGSSHPRD